MPGNHPRRPHEAAFSQMLMVMGMQHAPIAQQMNLHHYPGPAMLPAEPIWLHQAHKLPCREPTWLTLHASQLSSCPYVAA